MTDKLTETVERIERDIAWYEERGREMETSKDQLAFAVVIGATKALREVLAALTPAGECGRDPIAVIDRMIETYRASGIDECLDWIKPLRLARAALLSPPAEYDVKKQARELLAAQWDDHDDGDGTDGWMAAQIRRGALIGHPQIYAIRAIEAALLTALEQRPLPTHPEES